MPVQIPKYCAHALNVQWLPASMIGWAILNSFVNGVENTGSEDGMVELVYNTGNRVKR